MQLGLLIFVFLDDIIEIKPMKGVSIMAEKKGKQYVSDNAQLMAEWDWEKNNEFGYDPSKITWGSDKRTWWRCLEGHIYEQRVNKKALRGYRCPICSQYTRTSFNEKCVLFYVKKCFSDVQENVKPLWMNGQELDIFIPSLNVGIEYDGVFWHSDLERDINKDCVCKENGVKLYHIREYGCIEYTSPEWIYLKKQNNIGLEKAIKTVLSIICKPYISIDINISRDTPHILEMMHLSKVEASLANNFPELALEWNYDKNGNITPEQLSAHSSLSVWWKCRECGHEWKANINARARGNGCKKCANAKLGDKIAAVKLANNGSLLDHHPQLAEEWNYARNGTITPETITAHNNQKVWWVCKVCGHEWEATINNRSKEHGCPQCSRIRVQKLKKETELKQRGSLLYNNPSWLSEWNYTLNDVDPRDVFLNSSTPYWWTCANGHNFKASPNNRNGGKGCPYCSNHKVLKGFNDLETLYPKLLVEWDYEKNIDVLPNSVTSGSDKKVWWKCSYCGNEWYINIYKRVAGNGCAVCAGKKVLVGYNDLATTAPHIAQEWNYDKNIDIQPSAVTKNSNKKVWWKCKNGHEWPASVNNRTNGRGCPYCSKLSHSRILNVETGEIFESYSEASKKYKISVTPISNCCKGKQQTAGGYHWKYFDEDGE